MAVKIRLARRGRKKLAMYDVVVAHGRSPRDGVFIEKIGVYNPLTSPATIDIKADRAMDWLMKGAQPTETVKAMFSYKGLLIKKHLQIGVLKGAITQEEADKRFETWKTAKDASINAKVARLANEKETDKKSRMADESKINQARAAALREKQAARVKAEEKAAKAAEQPVAAVVEEGAPVAIEEIPVAKPELPVAEAAEVSAEEAPIVAAAKDETVTSAEPEAPEAPEQV